MIVEAQKSANSNEELRVSQTLIGSLRQEKDETYRRLKQSL
jgi:hypothetical protein